MTRSHPPKSKLPRWRVSLIRKRAQVLGYVDAPSREVDQLQPQHDHERRSSARRYGDPRARPKDGLHQVRPPRRRRSAGLVTTRQ